MARGSAYLVLPKSSSYDLKGLDVQLQLKQFAEEWYEDLTDVGLKVVCFAEDMLAVKLLYQKENITWLSTLGSGDSHFINTAVGDYPEEYKTIIKTAAKQEIIKSSVSKFKSGNVKDYSDEIAYRSARLGTLGNRIRFVANNVLDEAKYIIYMDVNNNFCNVPTPFVGDGKMIVTAELKRGVTCYTYGGIPMNRETFNLVMRSV